MQFPFGSLSSSAPSASAMSSSSSSAASAPFLSMPSAPMDDTDATMLSMHVPVSPTSLAAASEAAHMHGHSGTPLGAGSQVFTFGSAPNGTNAASTPNGGSLMQHSQVSVAHAAYGDAPYKAHEQAFSAPAQQHHMPAAQQYGVQLNIARPKPPQYQQYQQPQQQQQQQQYYQQPHVRQYQPQQQQHHQHQHVQQHAPPPYARRDAQFDQFEQDQNRADALRQHEMAIEAELQRVQAEIARTSYEQQPRSQPEAPQHFGFQLGGMHFPGDVGNDEDGDVGMSMSPAPSHSNPSSQLMSVISAAAAAAGDPFAPLPGTPQQQASFYQHPQQHQQSSAVALLRQPDQSFSSYVSSNPAAPVLYQPPYGDPHPHVRPLITGVPRPVSRTPGVSVLPPHPAMFGHSQLPPPPSNHSSSASVGAPDHSRSVTRRRLPSIKSSSTTTVFARGTLYAPDVDELLVSVSTVLQLQMLNDIDCSESRYEQFECFNDDHFSKKNAPASPTASPRSSGGGGKRMRREVPTLTYIYAFLKSVYQCAKFSAEVNVLALILVNRLVAVSGCPVHVDNWRPLMLTALLISQKMWDDVSLANHHFVKICPMFSLAELSELESNFLGFIHYDIAITSRLYAKYYFELRALAERECPRPFRLPPLTLQKARQLEEQSRLQAERQVASAYRSSSSVAGSLPSSSVNGAAPSATASGASSSSSASASAAGHPSPHPRRKTEKMFEGSPRIKILH